MSKQIPNQGNSKVQPGDMQTGANKPASKPTYLPPGHQTSNPSGCADDPARKMEFDTSKEK
jgi:hypothetical protein